MKYQKYVITGQPIDYLDLRTAHRMKFNKPGRSRDIIVAFLRNPDKDAVLKHSRSPEMKAMHTTQKSRGELPILFCAHHEPIFAAKFNYLIRLKHKIIESHRANNTTPPRIYIREFSCWEPAITVNDRCVSYSDVAGDPEFNQMPGFEKPRITESHRSLANRSEKPGNSHP